MRGIVFGCRVFASLACVVALVALGGCGGGSGGITTGTAGKIIIPEQSVKLVDDAGRATERTLTAPSLELAAGQEATYTITASNMAGVAGAALRLNFSGTGLTCTDAAFGPWVSPAAQTIKNPTACAVAVAGTLSAPAGSAVVAAFHLKAAPGASGTASIAISGILVGDHGQTIGRTSAVAGISPQQTGTTPGDLLGDHQPEVGSAIKILRVIVSIDAPPPSADLSLWDCNGNGVIDVADAVDILRCVVGLDPWPISPGLDPALIGTWQPVSATVDGAPATLASVEGWSAGVTNSTKQFDSNGTFTAQFYVGNNPSQTSVGTWTASGGGGKIVLPSATKAFTYAISGNVFTFTRVGGGHTYVQHWAKIVTLTEHDPAFVMTWRATSATRDGAAIAITSAFNLPSPATDATVQFFANGTLIWRACNFGPSSGDEVIDRQTGTWATGGGTFTLQHGTTSVRGLYSGALTTTSLGQGGDSDKTTWSPFAPVAPHQAIFVGTWKPTSGTKDGHPDTIADIFGLVPPADSTILEFWSDGTFEATDLAGTSITRRQLRTWTATAIAFAIVKVNGNTFFAASYTTNDVNTINLQATTNGHTYTIVVARQ